MRQYSSIEELNLMLVLYPNQKQAIIEEAGNKFQLDGEDAFFVVAEDGNCALFNDRCELDDLSKVKEITENTIRKDITSINIPDSVKSIGDYAFFNCTSLESIDIPDSVKIIGHYAFVNCISLKSINIPDSVKSIGNRAFFDCTSLEEVIFKGKTLDKVKSMRSYPWEIQDESIIKGLN